MAEMYDLENSMAEQDTDTKKQLDFAYKEIIPAKAYRTLEYVCKDKYLEPYKEDIYQEYVVNILEKQKNQDIYKRCRFLTKEITSYFRMFSKIFTVGSLKHKNAAEVGQEVDDMTSPCNDYELYQAVEDPSIYEQFEDIELKMNWNSFYDSRVNELDRKILRMLEQDVSVTEMARCTGKVPKTINNHLKKMAQDYYKLMNAG